jgi:hypothetical protein
VSTIAEWLASLGLSEYAERFAENYIDTSVLRDLTDQDLKDLGVPLGHRRKLLRAIVELGSATSTGVPSVAAAQPAPQVPLVEPVPQEVAAPAPNAETAQRQPSGAERRQLTVPSCDLDRLVRPA